MKLKYHLKGSKDGILLLEAEPQQRLIFTYSQVRNTIRVPFPYLLFTVRYLKNEKKFQYPGIYGSGLRVFCRPEPITSVNDLVYYPPTDAMRKGLVCTDHGSDNKQFKSVEELATSVVSHWWSHLHMVEYQPFAKKKWEDATLDDLPKAKWTEAGTYLTALPATRAYYGMGEGQDTEVDSSVEFVDEPWPPQKK